MEVCTLSRGITFKSLSTTLHNSIRFLHPPLPAYPTLHLAARLPLLEADIRAYPVPY